MTSPSFTGRRRARKTSFAVRFAEVASGVLIRIGGVGTILAVTLIFAFLLWVVLPLFADASLEALPEQLPASGESQAPLFVGLDDYGQLAAELTATGQLRVVRLDTGALLASEDPFGEAPPTAAAFQIVDAEAAFGFADGSVRLARVGFVSRFLDSAEVDSQLAALQPGESLVRGSKLISATNEGGLREQHFRLELEPPITLGGETPIVGLDLARDERRTVIVSLDEQGQLKLSRARRKKNLLTGKTSYSLSHYALPFRRGEGRALPRWTLLSGAGNQVFLAWEDGRLERVDVRDPKAPELAEVVNLLGSREGRLTALTFLLGRSTLVAGDSSGGLRAWFGIKPDAPSTPDGVVLTLAHELEGGEAAVSALAASARSRLLVAGFTDGRVAVHHVTSEQVLAQSGPTRVGPVQAVALAPKEDGLLALGPAGQQAWSLDAGHPEASWAALFQPTWYEGYTEPTHSWQSSSGTDEFEPKLGLAPLVFGTIKATLYSLIFGAPLAILAALFTSEFLSRRLRTPVKSVIEMMASLPSVVLGFLAALVIAPFAQDFVPAVLALFFTVPLTLLLGAYSWQLLPQHLALRWEGGPRLAAMFGVLALGTLAAFVVGPLVEAALFGGNIQLWLDGHEGSPLGGWLILVLPLCVLCVALGGGRVLGPWFRDWTADWDRRRCGLADLLRFALAGVAVFVLAWLVSKGLGAAGLDPRGGLMGTYVQRNALIVGFVMGFAIIPIIYTLAEDALSSVPEHLRLASLGAGATQWQTAMRVVIPTATSGLFSALMIGLGRAVGETMIVLMATGNTAIMDWNIFNGFRTLSANIAVELPEAVKDSTHYRTLFFAALVLFAMTFAVNTAAEVVRLRFRKKAYQL